MRFHRPVMLKLERWHEKGVTDTRAAVRRACFLRIGTNLQVSEVNIPWTAAVEVPAHQTMTLASASGGVDAELRRGLPDLLSRRENPDFDDKEEQTMMNNMLNRIQGSDQKVRKAAPRTVGAIMSREPLMLPPGMRAREALVRLRQVGVPRDFMTNCYVVDESFVLLGILTVRDLIMAPESARLEQVMSGPAELLSPRDDQEEAVARMDRLNLVELPVVEEDNRLVGTLTAEDAMEVLQAEATEDMERMAAMSPSERPYFQTRIWDIYKNRVVWLLLLMISASVTGAIITYYEGALAAQVVLTAFIPMLMDTGGNCGSQSSVTVIRGLSLGEIRYCDWLRVAWKEIQVGLLCGVTLAAVNLAKLVLLNRLEFRVALVVSLTLVVTTVVSKLLGCFLPILASRVRMDPAVMASPLITTIADAISLVVYFRIAVALLGI